MKIGVSTIRAVIFLVVIALPAAGIFELTHEWHRAESRTELPFGTITRVVSEGELRVNGHGFPVAVEFKTERHLAGMGDEIYTIRYRYEGGSYRKQISAEGKNLSHTAMIRGHKYLDRSVPSGLFVSIRRNSTVAACREVLGSRSPAISIRGKVLSSSAT